MDMRRLINITEDVLSEGSIAYNGNGYIIVEDPSKTQIDSLMDKAEHAEGLRGILKDNHLYVWDGYYLNHDEACGKLGIESTIDLHLRDSYVEIDISLLWLKGDKEKTTVNDFAVAVRANRSIMKYYGNNASIMVDTGSKDEWLEDYLDNN